MADIPYEPELSDRLLRRVARFGLDARIRRAAAALLARSYSQLVDVDFYLKVFDSPVGVSIRSRFVAAEALRFAELSPDQQAYAGAVASAIVSNKHVKPLGNFGTRLLNIMRRSGAAVAVFLLPVWFVLKGPFKNPDWDLGLVFTLIGVSLLIVWIVPVWSTMSDKEANNALRELSGKLLGVCGGPDSVGPLLSVEGFRSQNLTRILDRLTAEDFTKVPPELLSRLLYPHAYSHEDKWIGLVLDAMEKVGMGSCVHAAKTVATRSMIPAWRKRAASILPILISRQHAEVDGGRLLRAVEGTTPDTLLRPMATASEASANLLQPADLPENADLEAESNAHG